VVVQFKNGETMELAKIPMEEIFKCYEAHQTSITFAALFAGTVHRSQGMTLQGAIIDCRRKVENMSSCVWPFLESRVQGIAVFAP
jgi:hypothetical protein